MTRLVFVCAALILPGCARATSSHGAAAQQPAPAAAHQDTSRARAQGPAAFPWQLHESRLCMRERPRRGRK